MNTDSPVVGEEVRARSVTVARWPSEIPLLVFLALVSAAIWLLLCVSIIGIVYGAMIALFLFFAHVGFIAHVRGSAVRLGPDQFPDLYRRVVELAGRAGLDGPPEAYLMQEGGALNALATRFLRSDLVVLYSDLLEACGDDAGARDMIIGHELGHIKAGHLRWMWLLAPGRLVPFLGAAYSRAREFTCDRYGAALCGDRAGAARGLVILAAGGSHARQVNLNEFVRQRNSLDTGWMTLAKWLSGYPSLAERIAAVQPDLESEPYFAHRGPVRAILILAAMFVAPMLAGMAVVGVVGSLGGAFEEAALDLDETNELDALDEFETVDREDPVALEAATEQVQRDASDLGTLIHSFESRNAIRIEEIDLAYQVWSSEFPDREAPLDPFDGLRYGFVRSSTGFSIYSSGPDQSPNTADDIVVAFQESP